MAASENQGMQIALILFVILTLILSVTTFFGFQSYKTSEQKAAEYQRQSQEASTANQKTIRENSELKQMMGVAEAESIDNVKKQFDADMAAWAATVPNDSKTYRQSLELMFKALDDRSKNWDAETIKVAELTQRLAEAEKKKTEQVAVHEKTASDAQTDLAKERAGFTDDRKRLEDQLTSNQADLEKIRNDLARAAAEAASELKKLTSQLDESRKIADNFREERNQLLDPTFEVADGEIVWINQGSGTVWINIGRDDSLKRKTSFSVYTSEANDLADPEPKGKIEVTQILGQHLAEARILEDSLSDPLLIGDLIFTPTWTPGRSERFALAGFMDLNEDGLSDRSAVRNLIQQAGGIIDFDLDDEGKTTGEMTQQTRFLVIGDQKSNLQGYSDAVKRAKELGLEVLRLPEFLDHVGFKDPKRVLRFGITPYAEFKGDRKDGEPRSATGTNVSKRFEPRKPRQKRNTAYDLNTRPNSGTPDSGRK
ncbi:MAG: hypothetical protein K1X74_21215 [Pirellulales bacterium]|nr:hypothetical protein [Pirellulales bacterium]